ncbi:netrin-1-like [Heptranchias perlo]|uniref:netrin-1-like n=1 Tax=Heptranchias perlo TaxID=212740 RepID=UPI00355A3BC1
MACRRLPLLPLCACLLALGAHGRRPRPAGSPRDPCYHGTGLARRCEPEIVNAALGRPVRASSICGRGPALFCRPSQIGARRGTGSGAACQLCDDQGAGRRHPPSLLTDPHDPGSPTCWQSEGGPRGSGDGVGRPRTVTLTLPLGRAYELSRVSLRFCTALPESTAIYKSGDGGRSWAPLSFHSARCRDVYGRPERARGAAGRARCTGAHSRPRPAGGGAVSFRAGVTAARLDSSPLLREWVTATHLRVVFSGLRPPGGRPGASLARSGAPSPPPRRPYYSVSDFQARGRCKCNGHASRCPRSGANGEGAARCDCRHQTAGRECQECQRFYRDRPWQRATASDAHECAACDCNRHSTRCRFSVALYEALGRTSGGVCLKCRHNTAGRHCHYCRDGYARDANKSLTHRKACKVIQARVTGSERQDNWWAFNITIRSVYKRPGGLLGRRGRRLWVPARDLDCGCPRLRAGRAYLLAGGPAGETDGRRGPLLADRRGVALPWRESWARRLRAYRQGQRRGACGRPGGAPTPWPGRASPSSAPLGGTPRGGEGRRTDGTPGPRSAGPVRGQGGLELHDVQRVNLI